MSQQSLQVVWSEADTHEVFQRVATFHAAQAADQIVVDETGLVIR